MSVPHETWSDREFVNEVRAAGLPHGPGDSTPVREANLASLPETAKRFLRFMGVVERPRDWSFRMKSTGRFRMRPGGPWMNCEAWQYNTRLGIARIFVMTMRMDGLIPVIARDTYVRGRGRMLGKVLGLITIADGRGPELDTGELVTWLNDAVLIAPSMLLGPETTWSPVDGRSFDVALTDRERVVSARVTVDDRGAPVEFSTTDRFRYDYDSDHPGVRWVRGRWTTPVEAWRLVGDRPQSTFAKAVWHLRRGDFVYAEFRPRLETLEFNVPPWD